jgi:hypothetical protein
MQAQISRDHFKRSFAPIVPLIEEVVQNAREATDQQRIAKAIPELTRPSGIARLSGTGRWILSADGMVDRVGDFPEGFYLHSTEAGHNQGKYIFGCPLGVFTFKREPHEEDKGVYLQDTIDILDEQQPLSHGVDEFAGLKAYVSVPATGAVSVIVERPDAVVPMKFLLDEFVTPGKVVAPRGNPVSSSTVRSTRKVRTEEATEREATE